MGKLIDLTGQRFGRWTVTGRAPRDGRYKAALWACRCDCGNEVAVSGDSLRNGTSKQCFTCSVVKHGGRATRLYATWNSMKQRCENPRHKSYRTYGARGIKVCDAWQSFGEFQAWALAYGYREGLSIERINADQGYAPDNCEFITVSENTARANRQRGVRRRGQENGCTTG